MAKRISPKLSRPKADVIRTAAAEAAYRAAQAVLTSLALEEMARGGDDTLDYLADARKEMTDLLDFIILCDIPRNWPEGECYRDPAHYLKYAVKTSADKARVERALALVGAA